MKCGYVRVSTDGQNLDLQRDALKKAGVEKVFEDTATGSKMARPGLDALLSFVREGDSVTVWKLDRLGRSTKHMIELAETFNKRGVDLISITEPIDTTTAAGKLVYQIFVVLGEFERNQLIERTRAGLAAGRARGKFGGRPPVLDADKQLILRDVLKRRPRPSVAAMAKLVGVSATTIRRFIEQEKKNV